LVEEEETDQNSQSVGNVNAQGGGMATRFRLHPMKVTRISVLHGADDAASFKGHGEKSSHCYYYVMAPTYTHKEVHMATHSKQPHLSGTRTSSRISYCMARKSTLKTNGTAIHYTCRVTRKSSRYFCCVALTSTPREDGMEMLFKPRRREDMRESSSY
jgi:hypothetical protein